MTTSGPVAHVPRSLVRGSAGSRSAPPIPRRINGSTTDPIHLRASPPNPNGTGLEEVLHQPTGTEGGTQEITTPSSRSGGHRNFWMSVNIGRMRPLDMIGWNDQGTLVRIALRISRRFSFTRQQQSDASSSGTRNQERAGPRIAPLIGSNSTVPSRPPTRLTRFHVMMDHLRFQFLSILLGRKGTHRSRHGSPDGLRTPNGLVASPWRRLKATLIQLRHVRLGQLQHGIDNGEGLHCVMYGDDARHISMKEAMTINHRFFYRLRNHCPVIFGQDGMGGDQRLFRPRQLCPNRFGFVFFDLA